MLLTKADIQKTFGENIVFLFKGTEPFTSHPRDLQIPLGVVLADKQGKIICYECSKSFDNLGQHVRQAHSVTPLEYKDNYGINKSTQLCSELLSNMRSEVAIERGNAGTIHRFSSEDSIRGSIASRIYRPGVKMQKRNLKNTCPEQYKQRLALVCDLFSGNPTFEEVNKTDRGVLNWACKTYGTFNKAKEALGYQTTPTGGAKNTAKLIYDLRVFVSEYKCLPFQRKHGGKHSGVILDFPHSETAYRNHFGSLSRAWRICGVKKRHGFGHQVGEIVWKTVDNK